MRKSEIEHNKLPKRLLCTVGILFILYLVCNVVFWFRGTPAVFFKYSITDQDTVQIDYCSTPFFLLRIPDTIDGKPVTVIGSELFLDQIYNENGQISDCKNHYLKNCIVAIHIPDTVNTIGFEAFRSCHGLRYINMPSSLKCTDWGILENTRVKKLVFPENITEIGYNPVEPRYGHEVFAGMNHLKEVVFPDTLKRIGNNTFANCPKLKKVVLPDGIEEIDFAAFSGSGLKEINLPDTLVNLRGNAFWRTPFEEQLEKQAVNGFVILNDRFLYEYVGEDEHIEIPDGIVYLCDRAFSRRYFKTVSIPESVKYINGAFEFCSVEELVIPDTVNQDSNMRFNHSGNLKRVVLPDHLTTITNSAFYECAALESIHIPAHITEIGPSAFAKCKALKEITLPDGVITIGNDAFSDSGLETINIPDSVTAIGKHAFQNTPFDLTDVNYTANGATIIGENVYTTE